MPRNDSALGLADPRSLPEAIASVVIERIYTGEIKPGEKLQLGPLARSVGTSMMPVRSALHLLESLGLVVVKPRRGTFVRDVSRKDAESTYQARLLLEPALLKMALPRFPGSAAAREAKAALDEMVESRARDDLLGWRQAHRRFHWALYAAANAHWLLYAAQGPFGNSERYRLAAGTNPGSLDSHRQIYDTCMAGPSGMEEALDRLRTHLMATLEAVRSILPEQDDSDSDDANDIGPITLLNFGRSFVSTGQSDD